jgi:hypothetical protein
MWMQLLGAAGVPVVGEAFSRNWGETIRDANPHGFYESKFRRGVYFETNPDPRTGTYLSAAQLKGKGVKVFVPGLVRTERAYIEKVVATVRHWQEYVDSIGRLYTMERESKVAKGQNPGREPVRVDYALEWWDDNYRLMRDAAIRRYPIYAVSYDRALRDPETVIPQVFQWLGAGDGAAAAASVDPRVRTQVRGECPEGVDAEMVEVFDEYYERIDTQRPIDRPFIEKMNALHVRLEPEVRRQRALASADANRRRAARMRARAENRTVAP